jgi:hypothetical protein
MTSQTYDRSKQDVGNIVALEHVNVRVPDQGLATLFYVVTLGFTRDPYLMVGTDNMWINVGQQQFHLPTGAPQVTPGHIAVVVPDLAGLRGRLAAAESRLAGTRFAWRADGDDVTVTCPWGNRIRCHAPGPSFGAMTLGIAHVEFPVARGAAAGIARFYTGVLRAPAAVTTERGTAVARVMIGPWQALVFREADGPVPSWDGHHVAIYIADFAGPHRALAERGLITEESGEYQYRFEAIVDPDRGARLYTIEHEVRSLTHPMFLRPLINRNPRQRQAAYAAGRDAFVPDGA